VINAPSIEHVTDTVHHLTDTVQDAAHAVAERTPEIASAVGRSARSTVDTVSDAVTKLAALTPWVEAPKPQHHRARWMLRAAIVATVAGLAMWFANRRRNSMHAPMAADATRTDEATPAAERRFASAGR